MARSNVCWGIDIGAGAIKAIKLEAEGDSVKVLEYAVIPHPKVLSTPDIDQGDALRVSLGALVSQFDLSGAQLAVSVPSHQALARFAKLPPVDPKKVNDIVKFEAVQQIPFSLDEVEWDFQTFVSPDSPEVEVGIFAITKARLNERLTLLQDVGLVPDLITLSSLASYNAMAYDLVFTEQTPGTIIMDVGNVSTDVIVADAGRVWIRTFPMGGHAFTEALVDQFKLSYSKAEKLKTEAEQSKHARHVFSAMRPVFGDLAQEVQRSIGYYTSLHPDAKPTRLIGAGSTFLLPGLRKYLKQQLDLDVYRIEKFKRLNVDEGREAAVEDASLGLATAYGLALQGLGLATLEANLMPKATVRENLWKRKTPWFAVAAGIAAVASASMFIRPFMDSSIAAGVQEPSSLRQVIRRSQELKDAATAAGVLGASSNDYRAAALLSLGEGKGLYQSLLTDVSVMIADAQQTAADGGYTAAAPVLSLLNLQTSFGDPAGQAQTTGRPRNVYEDPEESGGATEAGGETIRLVATFETAHPEPFLFAEPAIRGWIVANAERDGLPYHFVGDPRVIVNEINASGRAPGTPGGTQVTRARSGRGIQDLREEDPSSLGYDPSGRSIAPATGGRPGVRGGRTGDVNLDTLAPIEMPEGAAYPARGTITVEWDAVLRPVGDES